MKHQNLSRYKCPKCNSFDTHKKTTSGDKVRIVCNDCKRSSMISVDSESKILHIEGVKKKYNVNDGDPRYKMLVTKSEHDLINEIRGIKKSGDGHEVDIKHIKHLWLKDKGSSIFVKNPKFEEPEFDPEKINWDEIVKPIEFHKPKNLLNNSIFDRIVYTDTHVSMEPNPDGYSQYGGRWNEEELMNNLQELLSHVILNQKSNTIIIDDLGDFMDGWDAKTVRRQHDLPQNMDNQKSFDVGLSFKIQMIIELSKYYDKFIINNICRSNHSAAFDYVVNSAFKKIIDISGINATVGNHRKFMNHYSVNDYTFIITHGKDDVNMKFGFKPKLDKDQIEKIDDYIDFHFLYQPGSHIEFCKGDSHQLLFDYTTATKFFYQNYPAFSPGSSWVQVNHKKGLFGFMFSNYYKDRISNHPYFFKWKTL